MNGKLVYTIVPPAPRVRAVQDEWGLFDPNQAGLKAAFRAVRALNTPAADDDALASRDSDGAAELTTRDAMPETEVRDDGRPQVPVLDRVPQLETRDSRPNHSTVRQGVSELTVRESAPVQNLRDRARLVSSAPSPRVDEADDMPVSEPQPRAAKTADRGAVYTLEFPTQCPQCGKEIGTVRVSRLLRTQVSFTSTLPRKGYIIVCPECDGILSAELSGLI